MKTFEQLIIETIKEIEPIAWQMWKDKRGWYLPGDYGFSLQIWIYENSALVSPQGFGSTQSLIAKNPKELKECADIWWRNRETK